MSVLIIGKPVRAMMDVEMLKTKRVSDVFKGLSLMEKKRFSIVVFNLADALLEDQDIERIVVLLERDETPALVISSNKKIKDCDSRPYIEVIPPALVDELFASSLDKLNKLRSLDKQLMNISKQKRSLPFYLLGALLFLEPVVKLCYLRIMTEFPFLKVVDIAASIESPLKVFEFWFLFPLAGLALVRTAWWSLFVFAGVHLYSVVAHFSYEEFSWPYVQESPHISSYLLLIFNTAIGLYFVIPENRRPFTRKTKEMFRSSERFDIELPVRVLADSKYFEGVMSDISDTGALIRCRETFSGNRIEVQLEVDGEPRGFDAQVVREVEMSNGMKGVGVRFDFDSRSKKRQARKLVEKVQLERKKSA